MKQKLIKLLENSYSPYSKVKVASIAISNSGDEYKGVNVESAAYGSTICAERSAILNAISNGVKSKDFKELHLISNMNEPLFPCGQCRQVMVELFKPETKIHIHSMNEEIIKTVAELMPGSVSKESFGWK